MAASLLLALALQSAAAPGLNPNLQPLAFLVGSCWRAPLRENVTDTHCFSPIFGGAFVRDQHALSGVSYAGESIYRWDSAARQIRFDYYQSQGLLISGAARATESGLAFELGYTEADGRPVAMRAFWNRDGADAYVVTTEVRDGEAWRAVPGNPRFTRVGPAPAR